MNKNSAAQKVQEAEAPKMTVVKPQEEKKAEVINKTKAEDVSFSPVVQEIKPLTIEEIKRKSEVLTRLAAKYDQLQEKRKKVENFKLSHDKDSTLVRVFDSGGEVFESSSPKTIGRLLDFWFEEFSEGLQETEKQMREIA
jgi:hypothetical protein